MNMNRTKTIYTTLYLIFLMAFTGCTSKLGIKPAEGNKSSINLELNLGKTFTKVLDSAMAGMNEMNQQTAENPAFFDTNAIKKSIEAAGYTDVKVMAPSRSVLNLSLTGKFDFVEYTKTKTTVRVSPDAVKNFSNSLGEEFKSVMDLFMAPVLTDEKMSIDEYKDLVAVVYGEELAADLASSTLEISVTSPKGKTKNYKTPLVDLLTMTEEKIYTAE